MSAEGATHPQELRALYFNFKWSVWKVIHPIRARRLKKSIDAEIQYFRDEIEKVTAIDYRRLPYGSVGRRGGNDE